MFYSGLPLHGCYELFLMSATPVHTQTSRNHFVYQRSWFPILGKAAFLKENKVGNDFQQQHIQYVSEFTS
jgi:hypothetical protein